ncbi:MAG: PAS domain S-box protein, partial [Planctomycetota bacterium]
MSFFRPQGDSSMKDRRYIIVVLRLIVFTILYIIAFQEHNIRNLPWFLWLILGLFILSEIACLFENRANFYLQRILGWIFILDAVLISWIIYILSVKATLLFVAYFSVIAIAAMSKSVAATFLITLLISVFYFIVSTLQGNFVFTEFITRPLFFFGIAMFSSYLAEEVSVQYKRKEEAEKVMDEAEQKYLNLITNPLVGVYQASLDGECIYVNETMADMLEYGSPRELLKKNVADLYKNPESRTAFIGKLKEEGYVKSFEVELVSRSGKSRNMLISGALNGDVISGVVMDITGRKRAEEQYRLLAENVTDVIWTTDMNFRFTYFSPSVTNLMGYSVEEAMNLKLNDFLPPESLRIAMESVQKALKARKKSGAVPPEYKMLQLQHIRKDKRVIWVEISGDFTYDENGNPSGIIGVTRDITIQQKAEEERAKLQKQVIEMQRIESIGRLAGGIAHDFNNILSVIGGYTELILQDSAIPEHLRDDVREIDRASRRAATLTRQLLAFSRKQMLQKQDLDINTLITDMNKMLTRIIGEDIELLTDLAVEGMNISADQMQIEQVLMNLAVNARDAMPDGGKLAIKTERIVVDENKAKSCAEGRTGEFVCLSIHDSGIGMSREAKEHLFEPFFTTKEKGKGTGLGLATVYGIIRQHDGWIDISSEPGRGTLVRIYLPAV